MKSYQNSEKPLTILKSGSNFGLSRLKCAKNGDFIKDGKGVSAAVAYAWYIWIKGYTGETVIRWIN